nr:hypothetical protein CFP56_30065 [Quercus suber]
MTVTMTIIAHILPTNEFLCQCTVIGLMLGAGQNRPAPPVDTSSQHVEILPSSIACLADISQLSMMGRQSTCSNGGTILPTRQIGSGSTDAVHEPNGNQFVPRLEISSVSGLDGWASRLEIEDEPSTAMHKTKSKFEFE